MAMAAVNRSCLNEDCKLHGKHGQGNICTHGWYKTKHGRRRRYRCTACGKTFSSTTGSSYRKLKSSRQQMDQACQMSAEGVNISTIARVLGHTWNTINRWLERARLACCQFLNRHLRGYEIREPQADEIKTFVGPRKSKTWIMAIIEVSTRLWPVTRVGARSYKNIHTFLAKPSTEAFSKDECSLPPTDSNRTRGCSNAYLVRLACTAK